MPSVGYSGTPLPKKLGIKPNSRVVVVNSPENLADFLEPLPEDVALELNAPGPADVFLAFATKQAEVEQHFRTLEPYLAAGGRLWLAWPKKAAKILTDVTFETVQREGLALGIVDTKVCAVSEIWTGLCFMRRSGKK
ncbi:MAG: DUF3052 domain-containing protein [Blastocatellia bacterium]|nr:DUF3052 domain-containing protein [Blastocatellia bacterium]